MPLNKRAREKISIHSPYTGRDLRRSFRCTLRFGISIHSPYTGRDWMGYRWLCGCAYFNPLSLYRERPSFSNASIPFASYFNPLSLYRERHSHNYIQYNLLHFNPLSLYRERRETWMHSGTDEAFQSTLPIQGETEQKARIEQMKAFQSTLPIQGETSFRNGWKNAMKNFNPLSLYRERHLHLGCIL